MLRLQVLCKVVGSLSYYLNILHNSKEKYLISAKVIQGLSLKKALDIPNSG